MCMGVYFKAVIQDVKHYSKFAGKSRPNKLQCVSEDIKQYWCNTQSSRLLQNKVRRKQSSVIIKNAGGMIMPVAKALLFPSPATFVLCKLWNRKAV